MSVYNIRFKTTQSMATLVANLSGHGDVLNVNIEVAGKVGRVPPPSKHLHTPEMLAKAVQARVEGEKARVAKVLETLKDVLQNNPHAPMNKLAKAMNDLGSRTQQNREWTEKNLQKYVDMALEEMTKP